MSAAIAVAERGRRHAFTFADLLRYHGPGSPGGVAHAFKVLERGLPLLDPDRLCERREIVVETAFGGPGARDAFELVTRAVTGERYRLDAGLARPERGRARERFVFALGYRGRRVTLAVREGYVTDEFIDLARADARTEEQERRLDRLKLEMTERVLARPAAEVYDAELGAEAGATGADDRPAAGDPELATVVELERALLEPATRADPARVQALLHEDFREVGAAGEVWDRRSVVAALRSDPGRGSTVAEVDARRLGPDAVLVTYLAASLTPMGRVLSRRSSLWTREPTGGWRVLFHQGTLRP
jgi:hypothetical protein